MRQETVYLSNCVHTELNLTEQILAHCPWACTWVQVESGCDKTLAYRCFESPNDAVCFEAQK
jgi:hypothetical protein